MNLASPRTTLQRRPARGSYERPDVDAILDSAWLAHLALIDGGAPFVLPLAYARLGDEVVFHVSAQGRIAGIVRQGGEVSLNITCVDGLVVARSAFHHSVNYRSVVLLGRPRELTSEADKLAALTAIVEQTLPGRSHEARPPSAAELSITAVFALPLSEGSAKVRQGPPIESAGEAHVTWSGVLPLSPSAGEPQPVDDEPLAESVSRYARRAQRAPHRRVERGAHTIDTDPARLDLPLMLRFLHDESYWGREVTRAGLEQAVQGSLCFGLYEGEQQIGFARVLSDCMRFAYLADVFVLATHRGQGLGKWLVETAVTAPELAAVQRVVLRTRDTHSLYAQVGFTPLAQADVWMERLGQSSGSHAALHRLPGTTSRK